MKVRGGFAALISLLCFMVLVIVGGRANDTTSAELASSENLAVGGAVDPESLPHDHAEGDDHAAHTEGDDHAHAEGEDHAAHAEGDDHAHDPADPNHAHDPADPTHPHDPADPTHPHDPTDPTHPHDPTDPTHPHDPTNPTDPTHPHDPTDPTDPPPSVYTQTQLDLLSATQVAISPRYNDVNAAVAAGYQSINDAATGYEHFVNNEYLNTPEILNPATIESLVYKVEGANRVLVSGMYILPLGQSLANVPSAFATVQTPWHIHSNLCWALNPIRVVGTTSSGAAGCPRNSIYFVTPPMLHVWLEEQPCGWFADLEQAGGDCTQHPH